VGAVVGGVDAEAMSRRRRHRHSCESRNPNASALLGVLCCLLTAGPAFSATPQPPSKDAHVDPACGQLVERYVTSTRGWPLPSYTVFEEGAELGGRGFSVWHESDNVRKPPGGRGKSFHLEVDAKCRKVIRELAYQ